MPSWTAEASSGNDVSDLIRSLQEGNPTVIYGVGEPGSVPHTAVVAGYDASTGHWEILDPAYESEAQPRPWTTTDLEAWWGGSTLPIPDIQWLCSRLRAQAQ